MAANPTERWAPMKHHPTQWAAWTCTERLVAIAAGRGSGKSELAKRRVARFAITRPRHGDAKYLYAAPTRTAAKRIAWDDLNALLPDQYVLRRSLSELEIRTVFGSRIKLVGLEHATKLIEGEQYDGIVMDESCDSPPGVYAKSVRPATTHRKAWVWRIGAPKLEGPGMKEFRDLCLSLRDVGGPYFNWPSTDILTPAEIEKAKAETDYMTFLAQYMASWDTATGGIYYAYDRLGNVRPCPYRPEKPIVLGADFNRTPMAWILCHRWPDRLEVFDELWLEGASTPYALDRLFERYGMHAAGWELSLDASSSASKTAALLSDYALFAGDQRFKNRVFAWPRRNPNTGKLRPNPPKRRQFAAVNARLCNALGERTLFVGPNCRHLIDDLEARHYKPGTYDPNDVGSLGHISDALNYVVWAYWPHTMDRAVDPGEVTILQ